MVRTKIKSGLRDIRDDDVDDDEDWPRRRRRPSESSDAAAAVSAEATKGPGGIGSYLARQEFGSNDGQAGGGHPGAGGAAAPADSSGYVSHGSGGYPKLQLPVSSACKLLKAVYPSETPMICPLHHHYNDFKDC